MSSLAGTIPFFQLRLPSWHVRKETVEAPVSPAPAARKRKRSILGEGPIILKGTGNVQLGLSRYSRNDTSSQFDQYGGGFNIVAERRTEQSALTLSNSLGYSSGATSVGQLIGGYRTPKYALTYGALSGSSDSQLNIGGFARGLGLALPLRHGELDLLASVATQQDGTAFRILGLRRQTDVKNGSLTVTDLFGEALHGVGTENIFDLVYRRSGRLISTTTEVGVSHTQGVADSPDGTRLAVNFQADAQVAGGFAAFHARYLPNGFATLQNEVAPGLSLDLTNHHDFKNFGSLSVDVGHTDAGVTGLAGAAHTNLVNVALSKSFGASAVSTVVSYTKSQDGVNSEATTGLALTLTQQIRSFALNESAQTSSSTGTAGFSGQKLFSMGIGHTLFGGAANFQTSLNTFEASGQSTGSLTLNSLTYVRAYGKKADITAGISEQRTVTGAAPITEITTNIGVTRRFSKLVALRLGLSHIVQSGFGGGASNAITADIVAPLAFGDGSHVGGRANPKLPAVIHGIVTNTPLQSSPFNLSPGTQTRGFNNVLVVLDGKLTQRTDTNGEFEFRFVPQGEHTVTLETATIAPGLIADHDSQTIKVLGGQRAELQFSIGNFAGVGGRIFYVKNGVDTPLAGVGISVDGVQATTSDSNGHYSVGKLLPGSHKVSIVETTLPSTVTFLSLSKPASVAYGSSTKLDFSGVSLGGISGQVFLQSGNGFGDFVPAGNIYVVANPGDHASITGDDGLFNLDNLPPGKYTLEVDKESMPDGLTLLSGPEGEITVAGNDVTGIIFKLGAGAKDVVFTFNNGRKQPINVEVSPALVPPGGLIDIVAHSPVKVKGLYVESDVFGSFPLTFDKQLDAWTGSANVPALRKGTYSFAVTAHSKTITDGDALVQVDPAVPMTTVRFDHKKALAGHTMHVTLKILGPVIEGDELKCEDGYSLKLPKPSGRVFGFDMRLWSKGLPYTCSIASKRGVTYALSIR